MSLGIQCHHRQRPKVSGPKVNKPSDNLLRSSEVERAPQSRKEIAQERLPKQSFPFYRSMTCDVSPLHRILFPRRNPHQDLTTEISGACVALAQSFASGSVCYYSVSLRPHISPSYSSVHSLFVYSNSPVCVPKVVPCYFFHRTGIGISFCLFITF